MVKVSILRSAFIDKLTDVSGIQVVNGMIYVISDSSGFLYKFKHSLELLEKVPLLGVESKEFYDKKDKPDFESMGLCYINQYPFLVVAGSASALNRNKIKLVKLPTNYNRKHIVWDVEKAPLFYSFLKQNDAITSSEINIEGLTWFDDKVVMLQRNNAIGAKSVLLEFDRKEMDEFVQNHSSGFPFASVHSLDLPNDYGFSGVDYFDNKLFFTAVLEKTTNAYDDGEVQGSAVGIITRKEFSNGKFLESQYQIEKFEPLLKSEIDNQPLKIESIALVDKLGDNKYTAIAVTDPDRTNSQFLFLELNFN